jgi:dipeptidyl-peptidase-3
MNLETNHLVVDQFADVQILKYEVPAFEGLNLRQRKLAYYLAMAGWSGRDIIYDQNYRHNLEIRNALESVFQKNHKTQSGPSWDAFVKYLKRVWFSNGIHHHYSGNKFEPGFSMDWFCGLLKATGTPISKDALDAMFIPEKDSKKCVKNPNLDMVKHSSVNFYDELLSQEDVEGFYRPLLEAQTPNPISIGLNSKVIRLPDGRIQEQVWHVNGLYGPAISKIVDYLKLAASCAENEAQKQAIELLIRYYQTGDLQIWDQFNIAWLGAKDVVVDFINGFTEVYEDPLSMKGTFESILQIKDLEASKAMQVITDHIQWFEDQLPINPAFKKSEAKGISFAIMQVASEAGDASPATPIGVNLPNADWIRASYGSKSVSLVNIEDAYNQVSGRELLEAFCYCDIEKSRAIKYGSLASKLHTVLHEVVGHASGKLANGSGTPKQTLKSYANTIEEARADLVALYYLTDPKLISWGLFENQEVGYAAYDQFIRNGLLLQLRRIEQGQDLEEDHMRNRQLIARWALDHGGGVIKREIQKGHTYFRITDYQSLRRIFGQLLGEVQRIKSTGDYKAARDLVETYAVKVDQKIHEEVLQRVSKLHIPPYFGFVNPELTPVFENGTLIDVQLSYVNSFVDQMLDYSAKFNFLKV